jgi:hypothetical protein
MTSNTGLKSFAENNANVPTRRTNPYIMQAQGNRQKESQNAKVVLHDYRANTTKNTQSVPSHQVPGRLADVSQLSLDGYSDSSVLQQTRARTPLNQRNQEDWQAYAGLFGGDQYEEEGSQSQEDDYSQQEDGSEEGDEFESDPIQPGPATPTRSGARVKNGDHTPRANGNARVGVSNPPVGIITTRTMTTFDGHARQHIQPNIDSQKPVHTAALPLVTQLRKRSREDSAPNSHPATPVPSEPEFQPLDYDVEKLKQMPFEALQNQSFDADPSRQSQPSQGRFAENTKLENKLSLVKSTELAQQEEFLKSLTMDEWEEAGDWFLQQFTDIVGKMRDARKEKRKITMKYEAEVAARYEVVDNRKKDMDQIMQNIRTQGASTLNIASRGRK